MGMYDTFMGKYTCLHCGNEVEFEEQTKDYEQSLDEFKLGDYIDRRRGNYFYDFTYECPICHADTELSIGIRKGQYVGVFLTQDARTMDPEELKNIEDGYQRRLDYEKMCETKLGLVVASKDVKELIALTPGETLNVLETTWTVLETYYEKLNGWRRLYHPSVVYRVHSGDLYRIIAARINPYTREYYYIVYEDGFEQAYNECYSKYKNKYRIQSGCTLTKKDEGGVVWLDDKESEKEMQDYNENGDKLIFGYPMDLPEMWVCQEPKTNKYSFGMELLLGFADTQASIKLVKDVMGAFTSWMVENGYDVNYRLDYWKVFRDGISLDRQYDTIEEAYAAFRVLALGYIINAKDTADAEVQNKTMADNIVFRYDKDIEKWRAYCEAPFEFELMDKNIVSLAEKVYMIIPAMEELVRACNRKADI